MRSASGDRTQIVVGAGWLMALAVGCGHKGGPTPGELGRAQFAWSLGALTDSLCRAFNASGYRTNCNASAALAVRATAQLSVLNAEMLPSYDMSSADPSVFDLNVAQVTSGSMNASVVTLHSHRAGSTKVVLTDRATGQVVDRLTIAVEDVVSIEPRSDLFAHRLMIMTGGAVSLGISIKAADGRELVGAGGVDYALAGGLGPPQVTLISALVDLVLQPLFDSSHEYARIEALAPGAGSISMTAPSGTSSTVPVEIVDASAVVTIEVVPRAPGPIAVGSGLIFDARARASDGEIVHSPACAWSLSPTSGTLKLDTPLRDAVQVDATAAGTAELTCTIGGARASYAVTAR
jgi:hypothetical protein